MNSLVEKTIGPGTFHRHLTSRQGSGVKKALAVTLLLTPMVDMFSLLVVFLLQAFSSTPELMVVTKGLTLPDAVTGRELVDAPLLSVSKNGIYLDQKRMGNTDVILRNPDPLLKKLELLTRRWKEKRPDTPFTGEINLQADKDLPSTVISQVMALLPSQHYGSIQLTVVSGGMGETRAE